MGQITLPYNFEPRWYQERFLEKWDSGFKRLILVGHRRLGKDKMVIANLPKYCMQRVGTYFYMLPTYNQARKVIWNGSDGQGFKFLDHFPASIVKRKVEDDMIIELTNGSIVQFVGADNIDRIVGTNPVGVILSEYSLMKEEVWNYLSPILTENGGFAVFVFTPRGQNHAYKLMKNVESNPRWHIEMLPVSYTNAVKEEDLLEQKANMPLALYEQEYELSFTQSATAVFKDVTSRTYPRAEWKPHENTLYKMGVDLAKAKDYTVITAIDLATFKVAPQEAFNQIDYTLQKARIEASYYRYNKPPITMDGTGVGSPVIDDLSARGLNIEPFVFTYQTRNELLQNLQILLEQDTIKIPDDPELIKQLESAEWTNTDTQKPRITVPDNIHDDHIMSLALSVWNLPRNTISLKQSQRMPQTRGVSPMYDEWGI